MGGPFHAWTGLLEGPAARWSLHRRRRGLPTIPLERSVRLDQCRSHGLRKAMLVATEVGGVPEDYWKMAFPDSLFGRGIRQMRGRPDTAGCFGIAICASEWAPGAKQRACGEVRSARKRDGISQALRLEPRQRLLNTDTSPAAQGSRRYVSNVLWTWGGTATGIIIAFLVTPYMVRKIGYAHFGIWTLTLSLVEYYWLIDIGLRSATIKFAAEYLCRWQERRVRWSCQHRSHLLARSGSCRRFSQHLRRAVRGEGSPH